MDNGLDKEINKLVKSHIGSYKNNNAGPPDLSKEIQPRDFWFVLKEITNPPPEHMKNKEIVFKKPPLDPEKPGDTFLCFVFVKGSDECYNEYDGLTWERFKSQYFSLGGEPLDSDDSNKTYILRENFIHKEQNRIM